MADDVKGATGDYSLLDRALHRFAFAHPMVQKALGEIEADLFAKSLADVKPTQPVFVTGLPRAGTTLLLETLHASGAFASLTYAHMPFVLAPMLWDRISAPHRKSGEARERAHGDGMSISFESPEAFEEVLWIAYLSRRFLKGRTIAPLGPDDLDAEFRAAFRSLATRICAQAGMRRYLSKNNANIARLTAVASVFPDARIFVALRAPAAHVRSLMTQHSRFLEMHASDPFARDYMAWIGHYDFGANFRPIDFAGRGAPNSIETLSADFWLQYWIDAYTAAKRANTSAARFFAYDRLLARPQETIAAIAKFANLELAQIEKRADALRAPTTIDSPLDGADPALLAQAEQLYEDLAATAL